VITRHDSLHHALEQVETGAVHSVATIVFSSRWWRELTVAERDDFRRRAQRHGISLRSDSQLTSHFVEMRGSDSKSLSTERVVTKGPTYNTD
jgi:hypothetical protein